MQGHPHVMVPTYLSFQEMEEFSFVHYPVGQVPDVVSVSGAGDW